MLPGYEKAALQGRWGGLGRVAGLPGAFVLQAGGEAGAGTILSLIPHRCVQGLECLL